MEDGLRVIQACAFPDRRSSICAAEYGTPTRTLDNFLASDVEAKRSRLPRKVRNKIGPAEEKSLSPFFLVVDDKDNIWMIKL
jgi:hypothetical protein